MEEDEQTGALPDDSDKPPEAPKKHRTKGRTTGPKVEAETETLGEGMDVADASSESESSVLEHTAPPEEPPSTRGKAARGGDRTKEARTETPSPEPKPKNLVELLRFERKGGRRRR
jgi:hypothetical protein